MNERIIDTHAFIGTPGKLKLGPSRVENFERPEFSNTNFLVIPFTAGQTENTLDVVQSNRRFGGMYLMVNPNRESPLWTPADTMSVQEQYADESGVVGIKSHPALFNIAMEDKRYDPVYQMAVDHSLPVLLHASSSGQDYNSVEMTRTVLERYPNLKLILAHFGGANPTYMRQAVDLAMEYPRLFLNTTCLHHIGAGLQLDNQKFARSEASTPASDREGKKAEAVVIFKDATEKIPEQIIFGSDLGWYPPDDYSHWPVTEVDPAKAQVIFRDNPKKVFGDKLLID